MSDQLLEKVRERALAHVWADAEPAGFNAIMADVEMALVLARREGMHAGFVHCGHGSIPSDSPSVLETFPLPTRTRRVLREEPVPGRTGGAQYSIRDGKLHRRGSPAYPWVACTVAPDAFDLMRHAFDLHANPYRTEEVPADENDPWGDNHV